MLTTIIIVIGFAAIMIVIHNDNLKDCKKLDKDLRRARKWKNK